MPANAAQASQANYNQMVGDLTSVPEPSRALFDQDVYGLEWALPYAGSERPYLDLIIRERMEMLRAELADPRCHFLSQLLRSRVSHQLRARPHFQTDQIAVEQWIPSLRFWLTNGYFEWSTPAEAIVATLEAGDPRKKSAEDELADRRESAETARARNEAAGTEKVMAAVDALSSRALDQFIQVEEALHHGERIVAHGDDLAQLEAMHDRTRHDAARGDLHAQTVLTKGQQDDRSCVMPHTNPMVRRSGPSNT
jgi:hypothetical protein